MIAFWLMIDLIGRMIAASTSAKLLPKALIIGQLTNELWLILPPFRASPSPSSCR
jgi:hypothetical protein